MSWLAGEFVSAGTGQTTMDEGSRVYWLRIDPVSLPAGETEQELLLHGERIEVVEWFAPHGKQPEQRVLLTGLYPPHALIAVDYHRNRLMLPPESSDASDLFLRWQGSPPGPDAVQLAPPGERRVRPAHYFYTKGLFRGAMLGIGIYYLFLFLSVRVRAYGWLAVFVLALTGYTIVQEGDLRFFGTTSLGWENYWLIQHGLLVVNMLGGIQFARAFLRLRRKFPRWDRVLVVTMVANGLTVPWLGYILLTGGNPYALENDHTYLMFFTMVLLIGVAVVCTVRGQRSAILYALSFGVLFVGVLIDVTLNYWGYFPADPATIWASARSLLSAHSYYAGILGEVFLMAFAVASSINEFRRLRDVANRQAIASAEEAANLKESYNQDLARELAERTADVREKNRQLEERDILKSRFFANISHEFRTPLSLIKGPAEDLARGEHGELDDSGRRKLKTLLGQSTELETLIDQLLELSRLDAGKMKLRAGRRDLVKFVRTTVLTFSSLAEKRGVTLKVESELEFAEIWFDEALLRKVINNLVSNALKFTPAGGEICVTVDRPNDQWVDVVVRDTGRGIPAEQIDRVFERFFQVEADPLQHQHGSGIGLALVRELVELHGGAIAAQSPTDRGTEIRFSLPEGIAHLQEDEIVDASSDETKAPLVGAITADTTPPNRPPVIRSERPTVLVVEDFKEMREYIRDRLQLKFKVLEAADGKEGLKIARRDGPDLILSDVMMPVLDGVSLLAAVRGDPGLKHVPFILLTARGDEEDRLQGLAARADDYLTKPFDARELELRVGNLLRSRAELVADYRKGDKPVVVAEMDVASADQEFLDELARAADTGFADASFQLDELARQLKMSDATLRRRLKTILEVTPAEYLRTYRLQKAQQMILGHGFKTVAEVAAATGFSSPGYFARLYRKEFGQNAADQLRPSSN